MKKTLVNIVSVMLISLCFHCSNKDTARAKSSVLKNAVETTQGINENTTGYINNVDGNSKGAIAVGVSNGVFVDDGKKEWTEYKISCKMPFVFYDRKDQLWARSEHELFKLDRDTFKIVPGMQNGNVTITGVAVDNKNRIWLGTSNNGIVIWDGKKYEEKKYINTISVQYCTGMASLTDGTILIATKDDIFWCKDNDTYWNGIPPEFYPVQGALVRKVAEDMLLVDVGKDGPNRYVYYNDTWQKTSQDAIEEISLEVKLLNINLSDSTMQMLKSNSSNTFFYIDINKNIWEAKTPPGQIFLLRNGENVVVRVIP